MIKKIGLSNFTYISDNKKTKIKKNENIEQSKIEALKKAIENGEYKVDIKKTAKVMAQALSKT